MSGQLRWTTAFLDVPASTFDAAVEFWTWATATDLSAARGQHGEFATLLPRHGDACLRIQRIQDGPGGCHLDLHVDGGQAGVTHVGSRAARLGASVRRTEPGLTVLVSPGGLPFCVVEHHGEATLPSAVALGRGGRSRLDQLCLDIPADRFEAEAAFWAALTGWAPRGSSYREFASLVEPPGIPIRLLFQRRAQWSVGDPVRAHVDVACEDNTALARLHVEAGGARIEADHGQWIRMVDPTGGRRYCLTRRPPLPAAVTS